MNKTELQKRNIFIKASTISKPSRPLDIRTRGKNHVEEKFAVSDEFEDFFEYEDELLNIKPARELAAALYPYPDDLEPELKPINLSDNQLLSESEDSNFDAGFVVLQKKAEEEAIPNNIESKNDENKKTFEFFQCEFVKDDGERCKKQAKKGQEFCAIHKKFLAKKA